MDSEAALEIVSVSMGSAVVFMHQDPRHGALKIRNIAPEAAGGSTVCDAIIRFSFYQYN